MKKFIIYLTVLTLIISQPGLLLAEEPTLPAEPLASESTTSSNDPEPPLIDLVLPEPLNNQVAALPLGAILPIPGRDPAGEDGPGYQQEIFASKSAKNIAGLSGSFNVEKFSGAAVYQYDLTLPPGRLNLGPSVNLSYSSSQHTYDSPVGFGWSLAQSYVVRSAKAQNQLYSQNQFTLVLGASSMELVPVNLTDGVHGEYGAKIEEQFLKMEFLDNNSWQAIDKLGQKYLLGTVAASRQDNPADANMVYRWMLAEIRDTNDNFISYEYYKEAGQIYPRKIVYTGHDQEAGIMEIRFQPFYDGPEQADQRADVHNSYFSQFLVSTKYLIQEIQILVSNELIRKYNLTYSHGENGTQSLLASIQRSDYAAGQWSSLPATAFSYQAQNREWHQTQRNEWQVPAIVYDEQGGYTSTRGTGPLDVNGDGWLDYIMSDGRARINPKDNQENEWPGIETGLPERPFNVGSFVDFNGDLLPDYIGRFRNQRLGRDETRVLLNNGEVQRWQYSDVWTSQLPEGADPNFVEDLNGDSLADLVQIHHDDQGNDEHEWTAIIHLNNGNGTWTRKNDWEENGYFNGNNWQAGTSFLDVNNDNLPDLVKTWGTGPQAGVYLNNGQGWESEASNVWQVPDGQGNGRHLYIERAEIFRNGAGRFTDLNNDGWLDIAISYEYRNDYWNETLQDQRVLLNNGHGWVQDDSWHLPELFVAASTDRGWNDLGVRLLDLNADGLTDIIEGEGRPVQLNQSSAKANLLTTIDNGYGSTTTIQYQSSARLRDEQGNYKNPNLAFILPTASRVTTIDGLDGEMVTDYSYADANYYYNRDDLGNSQFAGFGLATAKTGNQVVKTYFHQAGGVDGYDLGEYEDSFYKKGRVYREEVLEEAEGQLILKSASVNKWLESDLENGRKFVYQDNSVSFDSSANGQQAFQAAPILPNNLNQQAVAQVSALKDRLTTLSQAQQFVPKADAQLLGQSANGWSKVYYLGVGDDNLQHFQYQVFSGSELGRDDPIEGEGEFAITRPFDGVVAYSGEWIPGQAPTWEQIVNEANGTNVNYDSWNARISNLAYIREGRNRRQVYSIGRIFLPFETSGLPEDITVTSVQLRLSRNRSNNGYNLQIVNSEQDPNREHLSGEDYNPVGSISAGQINDGAPGTNLYELNEAGRSWVNTTSWTKLALRAQPDFDREAPQDARDNYQEFYMSEAEAEYRPMLIIDYYYNNVRPAMPLDLQVEDRANPDDVADQNPEFSALYNDENHDGQAVAYQIQVIAAGNSFDNPLWDSGQIDFNEAVANGQRTPAIEYGGQALALNGNQYFWRIRFYDEGVNQNEGLWSTGQDYFYMDGSAAPEAPMALQTEARVNPQDLINQTPSFSAVYLDPNPIDLAKWYQLQVDDNQDFSSPVWDSNKTLLNNPLDNGARSQEIVYGAQALAYNGATYYWRIKFWDDEGENGTEGTWSEAAIFSMFNTENVLADFSAKAVKFHYDFASGNVIQEQGLGKVSAALNGVFLNTEEAEGDEKNSSYEYAEPVQEDLHILSAPKTKILIDPETQASSTVAITYDGLDFGMVEKANATKEDLKAPQVLYEKTFNNFGLVTQTKDPLNHRTNITYDSASYYPATTTNHLNQITQTVYDLKTGQVKRTVDPNGVVEERTYDAFGRLTEVKKTNPSSSSLITLQTLEYHDADVPSWVKQTNYPGQWFETSSYTYFDGLGRTIQTKEAADTPEAITPRVRAEYHFEEGQGDTALDSSLNHNNATIRGATWQQGGYQSQYALRFIEGNSSYVQLPGTPSLANFPNAISLEAAVRITSQPGHNMSIINKGGANAMLYLRMINKPAFALSFTDNSTEYLTADFNMPFNEWFTLKGVYDGYRMRIYVNSQLKGDLVINKQLRNVGGNFYIGAGMNNNLGGDYLFDGLIDDVKISEGDVVNGPRFNYLTADYQYDNKGNLARKSLPYINSDYMYTQADWNQPYTRYIYDVQNRVVEESVITAQHTYTTAYEYDGWNTLVTDANGKQKKFYRDAYNQLIQTDEYLNGEIYSTHYEYNLLGKITKITDSQGNLRNFIYDTLGRLLSQEEMHRANAEEFGVWTLEYDSASNLIRKTDAKGQVVTYTYDSLNRVLTENYQGQAGTGVTYTYDTGTYGKGRLYRVVSPGATTTYTYDKWGRVIKEAKTIQGRLYNTQWAYNLQSVPTSIIYPDNSKVYYSYNKEGLPTALRTAEPNQNIVTSMPLINNVVYSPLKQIQEIRYNSGIVSTNTFDPNQAYRLSHKRTVNPFALVIQDLSYTYDAVGNITNLLDQSQTLLAKNTAYEYDDLYRLTQATVTNSANNADYQQNYEYDIIGNILNKSDVGNYLYEYTNPYQASTIVNANYQYDQNGNLTSDSVKIYHYNYFDRLTSVDIDQGVVLSNLYDQAGQRTQKQLTSTKPNPLGGQMTYITRTTYPNSLYEEETSGLAGQEQNWQTKKIRHISLGNQTIAHFTVNPQGQVEQALVFGDHLGSANILTDSFGRPKVLYDYYPFGSTRMEQNIAGMGIAMTDQRYTGQKLDTEIGLYNYGARYYNQGAGRFVQQDPLAFKIAIDNEVKKITGQTQEGILANPQLLNSHAYTGNNPVKYLDPDGYFWREFWSVSQGLGNAVFSNNALGIGRVSSSDSYFKAGQTIGDVATIVQGSYEAAFGVVTMAAGVTGGILTSSSGVGAIAGAGVTAAGIAITGHGLGASTMAAKNLLKKEGKGSQSNKSIADKIANGHANKKHMGEFKDIKDSKEFSQRIQGIMDNPSQVRSLERGRKAYWDNNTGAVVIYDPKSPDQGTVFRPTAGKSYFDKLE